MIHAPTWMSLRLRERSRSDTLSGQTHCLEQAVSVERKSVSGLQGRDGGGKERRAAPLSLYVTAGGGTSSVLTRTDEAPWREGCIWDTSEISH